MERFDSLFEGESVGDQRPEVHKAVGNESDCLGVLIGVTILEFDLNLEGREVHLRGRRRRIRP